MTFVTSLLGHLERWRSMLFLTGATALLILAGTFATEATTDITIENHLVTGAAWTIVFLGYLGLYPPLSKEGGWLARSAGVCVALGAAGFGYIFLSRALDTLGVLPMEARPAWIGVLVVLPMVGINIGPLLYGVTSHRTRVFPRKMGYLLMVPSLIYYVNIGRAVFRPGPTDPAVTTVLVTGYTVAMFSVGYLLWTQSESQDYPAMTSGSTA